MREGAEKAKDRDLDENFKTLLLSSSIHKEDDSHLKRLQSLFNNIANTGTAHLLGNILSALHTAHSVLTPPL